MGFVNQPVEDAVGPTFVGPSTKTFACLPTQADCVSIPPGLSSGRRSSKPAKNRPCHRKRKGEGEDGDRRKEVVRSCSTAIRAMAGADGARAIAVVGAIYACCVNPAEVKVTDDAPPTFFLHAYNDPASVSSPALYMA
jgi:hypothetical protein